MKRWRITSVNLMLPIQIMVSLALGFSGLVDWWVILLVWVVTFDFNLMFD